MALEHVVERLFGPNFDYKGHSASTVLMAYANFLAQRLPAEGLRDVALRAFVHDWLDDPDPHVADCLDELITVFGDGFGFEVTVTKTSEFTDYTFRWRVVQ